MNRDFLEGTLAHCNRCGAISVLPQTATGVRENTRAWRLTEMMTLACGHLDAHWVYDDACYERDSAAGLAISSWAGEHWR